MILKCHSQVNLYPTAISKQQNTLKGLGIINRMTDRKHMSEDNLLNVLYNKRKPTTRMMNTIVNVSSANQVWEFDIKYMYLQRN